MQRLLALSAKYNYWIGSPEENEAVGVNVTLMVQLEPDGKLPPTGQLLVWAKLVLAVIPLIARASLAGFDKLTD